MEKENKRFAAFQSRDFRYYWFGQITTVSGNKMQLVALSWQMYLLTHSAFMLGLYGITTFLPILIFSLIGGSSADAFNRKKILIATQATGGIISLILGLLTISNHMNAAALLIVSFFVGVITAFDGPARQALVPSLVKREAFENAMSFTVMQYQIGTIAGPAIAGLLIAKYSVASVYLLNAFSFLLMIGSLLLIHASGAIGEKATPISLSAIKEGITFIKSKTIIWSTMILDALATFFASATALLPIFAKDILHVGPQGFGFLYSADAIGALIAGAIIAHGGILKNQGKVLLTSVACYAVGTIVFGLSHWYILSLLALMVVGAGDSISAIIRNTIRQLATPHEMRGRMTSVNMIFFIGGPQLGEFEAGILAAAIGAPFSVVIGGLGTLIIVGLLAWKIPLLREYKGILVEPLS